MRFFDRNPDDVLLVDAITGGSVTAKKVADLADGISDEFQPRLAFLFTDQSLESVTRFLALLEAGVPVLLLDAAMDVGAAAELIDRYQPELVLAPEASSPILTSLPAAGMRPGNLWVSELPGRHGHPDLSVLLSTSGSTGSPKLVRLSAENILANARAIATSLDLRPDDRAVTSLPLFYSFGMSLVTSHLAAGSSVLVTGRSVLEREFWTELDEHRVTHLAGVPLTYTMLRRLRIDQMELPHLRALLQAGGRLAPELVSEFHRQVAPKGQQFFVMYGQTEASPRMACLPPERLSDKLGSAGRALPGGRFEIHDDSGRELLPGEVGEIVYHGPNVMLGYGDNRDDLARGDDMGGVLRTGDLGYLDDEGYLYLTGRIKRIAKVAGTRVSLDDVEGILAQIAPVAAVPAPDDGIVVFTTVSDGERVEKSRKKLARELRIPYRLLHFHRMSELPLLPSGKVNYAELTELGAERG